MAIEFLQAKIVSRKNSVRSMPAHMAYRACTKIYDQRQKKTHNYTNKNSVLESFIVNGQGNDLEQLANKIEASENRKDAQLGREFILALPHELDLPTNKKLCQEFAKKLSESFGVAAHVAIHKPDELRDYETHRSPDSLKNVHAHITVTMRKMSDTGELVGNKIRQMNDRKWLENLKTETRDLINNHLLKSGLEPMEKRDPNALAQKHLGPELTRMERRGEDSLKGDTNRARERVNVLNSQKSDLKEGLDDLQKGLVQKGPIKSPAQHMEYPKGHPVLTLSRSTRDDLMVEIAKGKLRPNKWLAPGILESVKYRGLEVNVTELILNQRGFTFAKLQRMERAMDIKFGIDLAVFGVYPGKKHNRQSQDIYRRFRSIKEGGKIRPKTARLNTYIPKNTRDFSDNEALWHAIQAARNLEDNTNH